MIIFAINFGTVIYFGQMGDGVPWSGRLRLNIIVGMVLARLAKVCYVYIAKNSCPRHIMKKKLVNKFEERCVKIKNER